MIGAGPVGLAIASELAQHGLATLVVDRRPPPVRDAQLRPQLLVARAGDLGNLARLGLDVFDPWLVSLLATRCEGDLASGRTVRGDVISLRGVPDRARDLWTLAGQPPLALVPIGRLQQALLDRAVAAGATVRYECAVAKLRRHAREVSLTCADGTTARAGVAIVATGAAARALITASPTTGGARSAAQRREGTIETLVARPPRRMIGGLVDAGAPLGRWIRVELPVPGLAGPVRCTLLQTPAAGTGVLVDPRVPGGANEEQLHHCFAEALRAHGLTGAPFLVEPQVFTTAVTAMARRFVAGDGRAPVVVAGDAAQTGHVFSGQTCFVNVALAIELTEQLRGAREAIVDRTPNARALAEALDRYDGQSAIGSAILARTSERHYATHPSGAWALAGVAARA